jgi:hypothetical protein
MKPGLLFVAVHLGPYLSLAPLEHELDSMQCLFLAEGPSLRSRQHDALSYWTHDGVACAHGNLQGFMRDKDVRAILCGTSDGLPDGNLEDLVREAATECGVPVFVVEDFPGNYRACPRTRLEGLFVEYNSLEQVYQSRGVEADRIHSLGNPRYDQLRSVERDYLRETTRASLDLGDGSVLLWAGQPDGENSFLTLERMLPSLKALETQFVFKAHPRDELYSAGAYTPLLSQLSAWRDVTSWVETRGLCCAADLVLTQFSSVGVEASYLGTPALFVLFDDLGMAYLRSHKGYDIVPWASEHCAFLLRSSDSICERLEAALFDDVRRSDIRRRFDDRYGLKPPSAPAIASIVNRCLSVSHQ